MTAHPLESRNRWILLHLVLAGFATPALVLYLATGVLYTFGTKGEYRVEKSAVEAGSLDIAKPDLGALEVFTREALHAADRPEPSGESRLRRVGTSWEFEWTGTSHDVVLAPTAGGGLELSVKETTVWRHLVQLHKAKGGAAFHYLTAAVVGALVGVLALGYAIGWRVPRYRRAVLIATAVGAAATLLAGGLS